MFYLINWTDFVNIYINIFINSEFEASKTFQTGWDKASKRLTMDDENDCILLLFTCPTFLESGVVQPQTAQSNLDIMYCTSWSSEHMTV